VISAWLNFYTLAQTSPDARRLLRIYQRRLHSNLSHALRPVLGPAAGAAAASLGALIDGVYIRHALKIRPADRAEGSALVLWHLDQLLKGAAR
ncbi:MAG: TetR family transcriptional regulator C-terminal domain-containing protein, partial [Pseudomonadota bacterium]